MVLFIVFNMIKHFGNKVKYLYKNCGRNFSLLDDRVKYLILYYIYIYILVALILLLDKNISKRKIYKEHWKNYLRLSYHILY